MSPELVNQWINVVMNVFGTSFVILILMLIAILGSMGTRTLIKEMLELKK